MGEKKSVSPAVNQKKITTDQAIASSTDTLTVTCKHIVTFIITFFSSFPVAKLSLCLFFSQSASV